MGLVLTALTLIGFEGLGELVEMLSGLDALDGELFGEFVSEAARVASHLVVFYGGCVVDNEDEQRIYEAGVDTALSDFLRGMTPEAMRSVPHEKDHRVWVHGYKDATKELWGDEGL